MRSYRRMAAVAVLGALATVALSSCGANPDTAASVGSTTFTEGQVDRAVDSTGGKVQRDEVVQDMVLQAVCKNYATKNGVSFDPATAAAQLAQQGVPAGAYADLLASKNACLSAVAAEGDTQPTDEELRKLYDDVVRLSPGDFGTFEQAKQQFLQNTTVTNAFAVQHVYSKVAKDQQISVNPRYRTLTIPLLATSAQNVVLKVTLGETANAAVTDAPKPVATPSAAPPQN